MQQNLFLDYLDQSKPWPKSLQNDRYLKTYSAYFKHAQKIKMSHDDSYDSPIDYSEFLPSLKEEFPDIAEAFSKDRFVQIETLAFARMYTDPNRKNYVFSKNLTLALAETKIDQETTIFDEVRSFYLEMPGAQDENGILKCIYGYTVRTPDFFKVVFYCVTEGVKHHSLTQVALEVKTGVTLGQAFNNIMIEVNEKARFEQVNIYRTALNRGVRLDRIKIFETIFHLEVETLTPEGIKRFFQARASLARTTNPRRMNFDSEIKDLRAILNWYRETYNYKYVVPIIAKRLRASCTITKEKKIKGKLSAEEFLLFFKALDPFYREVALVQSRIAGRISEIAGLQFQSIDFENHTLLVKHVVVYGRRKEFVELKANTKTGDNRSCFITHDVLDVLKRRLAVKSHLSDYVFHIDGEPLKYRSVQHAYDHALKKVGLFGKTSGTHMVRHFTATLTRFVCGNLDAVQSVTGHKSLKLVEHYGALSSTLQADSISKVELFLKQKSEEMDNSCAAHVQDCLAVNS